MEQRGGAVRSGTVIEPVVENFPVLGSYNSALRKMFRPHRNHPAPGLCHRGAAR